MLHSSDFSQSHVYSLKIHCTQHSLSEISLKGSECKSEETQLPKPNTPPQLLTANNTYNHLTRTTAWLNYKKRDACDNDPERLFINAVEEREHQRMWDGGSDASEVQTAEEKEAWPVDDSEPSQGSLDSNSTATSFNTESTLDNESHCSVCEDQTASDDESPGRNVLDTPPPGILLRDPMLGALPAAWRKRVSIRPLLPETQILPRHAPVRRADTLILSPSLLTSPSQGLSHPLFPEGQWTLQTLFEDVWVTPESSTLKSPRLTNETTLISAGSGGYPSTESEPGNKDSEDEISTPEQLVPLKKKRKTCSNRHTARRRGVQTQAQSSKKKCVNGFIMFCRMNRKVYIRSHPGTPSTTVTRELANLWHVMPKQEKRLYCLKAWRFSCQQNRNVRSVVNEEEMEAGDPSPLHRLLAHREQYCVIKQRSSHFM